MKLETLGHATMLLRDDAGAPLLITDPWLLGSCYWRSWWLENPPSAAQIEQLARARFCYLTHEHPDHFHTPSLRKLGAGPTYLTLPASAPEAGSYLAAQHYRARTLEPLRWYALDAQVALLALPCLGGDSALLIATPAAVIINLNDARPSPLQIFQLRRLLAGELRGRKRILLASYSSAGLANSFRRAGAPLTLFDKRAFVRFVSSACRVLGADAFLPFASQVVFRRPDSRWANEQRVTFADLRRYFAADAELLPPYSRIDLARGDVEPQPTHAPEDSTEKVERELARELACVFDAQDEARLAAKLRAIPALDWLFPRGIGFRMGTLSLHYRRGALSHGERPASFVLVAPAQAVKDVLASGHFSDLSIPMFTFVELEGRTDPRSLYLFFLLVALHDNGVSSASFLRWCLTTLELHLTPLPSVRSALPL